MLLGLCEELLHGAINLGSITGAAGHGRDLLAGGFFDDVIKDLLVGGHGGACCKKASARHEQAMDFFQGERNILRVVNGKAG